MCIGNFNLENYLIHKTDWLDGPEGGYCELVCVSLDLKVSFTIYSYYDDAINITLRNLYVSPEHRGQGIATLIVEKIKMFCELNDRTLTIWCGKKLIDWYKSMGFVLNGNRLENDYWLSYNKKEKI